MSAPIKLAAIKPGARGTIIGFSKHELTNRLMEMGMTVGTEIEVAHEAPFGGAIAVRCRGTLIALRLDDAQIVEVSPLVSST